MRNIWKNGRFSGRLWPDWGNTARAAMAGLGSIGLIDLHITIYTSVIAFLPFFILAPRSAASAEESSTR